MQQGFYVYRNNIYFGSYPAEQVSGYQNVSLSRPERILTDHQISKEDQAVRFWENHHLLEPEYTAGGSFSGRIKTYLHGNSQSGGIFFKC